MEITWDRAHLSVLRHPDSEEYHQQVSAADAQIEDPSGVAAAGLYASDGLSLSILHNSHSALTLPLRERTGSICSPIFQNNNAKGLLIAVYVEACACEPGEGLRVWFEMVDSFSRKAIPLHGPGPLISTMGTLLCLVHPTYDLSPNFFRQILHLPVSPFWRLRMEQVGEKPMTYAVTHSFLL